MKLLSKIHQYLYFPIGVYRLYRRIETVAKDNNTTKCIYLLNIPSHGNLGDHLLSIAEQQFFKDYFPQYKLVLISSADLYFSISISLRQVKSNDVLCITGGGFLGSLYAEEQRFFKILRKFPNNKVIVLPQTIYYEDTSKGRMMLSKAVKQYAKHKHLYVIARDKKSYDLLAETLMKDRKEHIAFTPDLALYLKFCNSHKGEGVLWCLRNDNEVNVCNKRIILQLQKDVSSFGLKERYTDTYVNYPISISMEETEVKKKIEEISKAKIVITDRLHGMIYSVITGTPVIVMDNISGKVKQVYDQWIKHIPYIRFIDNLQNSKTYIEELLKINKTDYLKEGVISKYKPIIDFINATN